MTAPRHQLLRHRRLAGWLIAFAMVMKVLVPSGYMLGTSAGSVLIEPCSGFGPEKMVMAMPGMTGHGDKKQGHGKGEQPCAFASLAAPSLPGVVPILPAGRPIGVMVATILRSSSPSPSAPAFLRPHLRGPPAIA